MFRLAESWISRLFDWFVVGCVQVCDLIACTSARHPTASIAPPAKKTRRKVQGKLENTTQYRTPKARQSPYINYEIASIYGLLVKVFFFQSKQPLQITSITMYLHLNGLRSTPGTSTNGVPKSNRSWHKKVDLLSVRPHLKHCWPDGQARKCSSVSALVVFSFHQWRSMKAKHTMTYDILSCAKFDFRVKAKRHRKT